MHMSTFLRKMVKITGVSIPMATSVTFFPNTGIIIKSSNNNNKSNFKWSSHLYNKFFLTEIIMLNAVITNKIQTSKWNAFFFLSTKILKLL